MYASSYPHAFDVDALLRLAQNLRQDSMVGNYDFQRYVLCHEFYLRLDCASLNAIGAVHKCSPLRFVQSFVFPTLIQIQFRVTTLLILYYIFINQNFKSASP